MINPSNRETGTVRATPSGALKSATLNYKKKRDESHFFACDDTSRNRHAQQPPGGVVADQQVW
jgi:hypothetical protein